MNAAARRQATSSANAAAHGGANNNNIKSIACTLNAALRGGRRQTLPTQNAALHDSRRQIAQMQQYNTIQYKFMQQRV